MENPVKTSSIVQGSAGGDINQGLVTVHAGNATFPVGHAAGGATPYDLLSASLAACTAMTVRAYAKRKKFNLTHIDVNVFYFHGNDGKDYFDRTIALQGSLKAEERRLIGEIAHYCPVSQSLGKWAQIHTFEEGAVVPKTGSEADYERDLEELSIPNIDPD